MRSDDTTRSRWNRLSGLGPAFAGLPIVVVGAGLVLLALGFHGFIHGFFLGAAIVLIALGSILIGASMSGKRRSCTTDGGNWLPSRDGDR